MSNSAITVRQGPSGSSGTSGTSPTFTTSLTTNGYVILPGGLIIQWGSYIGPAYNGSSYTVNFPLTFPNICLNITGNIVASNGVPLVVVITEYDTVMFKFTPTVYGPSGGEYNASRVFWQAIGY